MCHKDMRSEYERSRRNEESNKKRYHGKQVRISSSIEGITDGVCFHHSADVMTMEQELVGLHCF